jgi:endonuclease/exonuclease/phosphatase family metal-dependent hydrolase
MLILSWNLFHGRSLPPTRQSLFEQFAASLAGWRWDVALLQEVPPWWPAALARASAADHRSAMTSRNSPLAPDAAIAHIAARDVDHLFAKGLAPVGDAEILDRHVTVRDVSVELSDHPPLRVRVE